MYLTKIGKEIAETTTHIEIEKVAADLLMISCNNDTNDLSRVFSYWRLGNGCNPPLEVGVNNETGTIKSIVFFVNLSCFKVFQFEQKSALIGNMMVDSSIFSKANDYVDNKGNYFVTLDGNRLICRFNDEFNIKETILNEKIEFYMDSHNQLRGFSINQLTVSETKTIKSVL